MGHVVNADGSRNPTWLANESSTQVPYTSKASSSLVSYRIPRKVLGLENTLTYQIFFLKQNCQYWGIETNLSENLMKMIIFSQKQ